MKAVFSSGANHDLKNILEYYRREAGADVAADFHSELMAMADRIKEWPESFPLIGENIRRAIFQRFPFQVVYRMESAALIRILVIRHHKQHPDFGLNR
jgi:plasmid stabilization system protein ParE